MTESNSSTDSDSGTFDLADFIYDWSELFVVMGVFGALAIYISRSGTGETSDAELIIDLGFVSAFAISLLMYVLIYKKLIERFGDWHKLYRAHFRIRNASLSIFTGFSMLLGLSLSYLIFQNQPVVFLIMSVGMMFVATGIVVKILYGVAQRVPDNPWWRLTTILVISLITLFASLWARSTILQSVEITTIQEMTYSDPLPVVLTMAMVFVAIVQTAASMGVLASIVGVPVLITDKFRGTGPYS